MPIRFTSPSLGGQRQMFLHAGEWELGVAYRRLTADEFFVGDRVDTAKAPGGQPITYDIHSVAVAIAYGVTDRVSLQLTAPFSAGNTSRFNPDGARHVTSAAGLGDVNLVGRMWLVDPGRRRTGNVALGLGVKSPTGDNTVKGDFGLPTGTVQAPVHSGIQLGDGGWGVLLEVQGFQRVAQGLFAYLYGLYQLSPR